MVFEWHFLSDIIHKGHKDLARTWQNKFYKLQTKALTLGDSLMWNAIPGSKNKDFSQAYGHDDITLDSHSGVSVCLASGQVSSSEETGRLAVPWRANGGWVVPCEIFVAFIARYPRKEGEFAYLIPRFN